MNNDELESIINNCIVCNDNLHSIIIDETIDKLNNAESLDSIPLNLIKAIKKLGSEKRMLLIEYGDARTEFVIINRSMECFMLISIIKNKKGTYNFYVDSNIESEEIFNVDTK